MAKRFTRGNGSTGNEYMTAANLVASATPHTVGAWVQIDASVAQDCKGLWIMSTTVIGVSNTATAMLLELGFGAAAAEVSKVQFYVGGHDVTVPIYVPLHIPAGTRLAGRIQGVVASDIYTPLVLLDFLRGGFGFGGWEKAVALGLNLAASAPTTGDLADNAYDQCIASTAEDYKALTLHAGINANAATAASFSLDVGIGAAAAERSLGAYVMRTSSTEICSMHAGPQFIEGPIPAGSRLSIKKNSTVDATAHLVGWR